MIGANLTVPIFSVILRKSYGLGAIAMTGGSYQAGDVLRLLADRRVRRHGPGGLGEARLPQRAGGHRRPGRARKAKFDEMVARAYAHGKALNQATTFRIDDVIDPADTRRWIMAGLKSLPPPVRGPRRSCAGSTAGEVKRPAGRRRGRRVIAIAGRPGEDLRPHYLTCKDWRKAWWRRRPRAPARLSTCGAARS